MEKELKGKWRLLFIHVLNNDTWELVSKYHHGMTIKFHTRFPRINGERYQIHIITEDFIRLTNPSDTIRFELQKMPETWPVKKKRRRKPPRQ